MTNQYDPRSINITQAYSLTPSCTAHIYACITFTCSISRAPAKLAIRLSHDTAHRYLCDGDRRNVGGKKTLLPPHRSRTRCVQLFCSSPFARLDHSWIKGARRAMLPLGEQGEGSQSRSTLLHPYPYTDCLCSLALALVASVGSFGQGKQTSWEGRERPNWCLTCGGTEDDDDGASSFCIVCNATVAGGEEEGGPLSN